MHGDGACMAVEQEDNIKQYKKEHSQRSYFMYGAVTMTLQRPELMFLQTAASMMSISVKPKNKKVKALPHEKPLTYLRK